MKQVAIGSVCILLAAVYGLFALVDSWPVLETRQDIYRVGAIAPLSGPYASYGREIQRGIELAREALRMRDEIELTVLYEDACIPSEGVPAAQRLIRIEKISALVGSYCMASMVPNLPAFEQSNTLAFQTSVVPEALRDHKYVLSTFPSIEEEASTIAEIAAHRLGARRAAILYLQTPWGESFKNDFRSTFQKLGGVVVAEVGNPIGVNNFRSELTNIKAKDPEVLFFVHAGPALGNAIRQARMLGLTQVVIAPDEAAETEVLVAAHGAAEGLLVVSPESSEETQEVLAFQSSYREHYQAAPSLLAAHSFDATMIATQAIRDCQGDRACMSEHVRSLGTYRGASGTFSIKPDGTTDRKFVVKEVVDGEFVLVHDDVALVR